MVSYSTPAADALSVHVNIVPQEIIIVYETTWHIGYLRDHPPFKKMSGVSQQSMYLLPL